MQNKFKILYLFFAFGAINYAKAQTKTIRQLTIYFDTDKAILKQTELLKLNAYLDSIAFDKVESITCIGHTDFRADQLYNLTLSQNRVESVKNYLIGKNLDTNKVKVSFKGEEFPVLPGKDSMSMAKNRRVEMIIEIIDKELVTKKNNFDTLLYCDTTEIVKSNTGTGGIVLAESICCRTKIHNCISIETITTLEKFNRSGLSLRDNNGDYLASQGMFKLKWNEKCGPCNSEGVFWGIPKEDIDKMGYDFYQYDSSNANWYSIFSRAKLDTIENEIYYSIKLNCGDFGKMMNKDRRTCFKDPPQKKRKLIYVKIKVPRRWDIVKVESQRGNLFKS